MVKTRFPDTSKWELDIDELVRLQAAAGLNTRELYRRFVVSCGRRRIDPAAVMTQRQFYRRFHPSSYNAGPFGFKRTQVQRDRLWVALASVLGVPPETLRKETQDDSVRES